jgi:hypothetical protein
MKRNLLIILSIILVFTMACGLFSKGDGEESNSGSDASGDLLGEEFRSEGGGFSIKKVNDYNFDEVIGIVNMTAPDADMETGPGLMAVGGISDTEMSNEDLLNKMRDDSAGLEVGKAKKIKVAGVNGLQADISGTHNEQEIKGRVAVVMVEPTQQFSLLGLAPVERWKELEPIFKAVLDSVAFFEPDPDALANLEDQSYDDTESPDADEETQENAVVLRQWASAAKASSQYGKVEWSASQATGAPNVLACRDDVKAWASYGAKTREWIELTYDVPVIPTEITIIQTYNPSQVVEVYVTDMEGEEHLILDVDPVSVDCPDFHTIFIEEVNFLIHKVTVVIDQSIMGWGWNEIDAVELVGYPQGGAAAPSSSSAPKDSPQAPAGSAPPPTNYSGWMAEKNYQGYLKVTPGKTKAGELDGLIGLTGTRSTENWKPRPDHKDTFIFKFEKDNMMAWISVTTDGVVYKKAISANTRPLDYKLTTVTRENYNKLDAIYKENLSIHYNVMANLLKSPGFLSENVLREDGRMQKTYSWWGPNGEKIGGIFYDDVLTGYATLMFLPPEK